MHYPQRQPTSLSAPKQNNKMKFLITQGLEKLSCECLYNPMPAFGGEWQNSSIYVHHVVSYRRSMHKVSLTVLHLFIQEHIDDLRCLEYRFTTSVLMRFLNEKHLQWYHMNDRKSYNGRCVYIRVFLPKLARNDNWFIYLWKAWSDYCFSPPHPCLSLSPSLFFLFLSKLWTSVAFLGWRYRNPEITY